MRRKLLTVALSFACGFGLCWLSRNATLKQPDRTVVAEQSAAIDCSQEIRVTRIHPAKHFAATLRPFHLTDASRQARLSAPPADGEAYWLVTFNGGTLLINASQVKGD